MASSSKPSWEERHDGTPLADGQVGAGRLDALNHVGEVGLFLRVHVHQVARARDLHLVLRLRLRRLEGTCQQTDARVVERLRHLRVRKSLVENQTVDERRVLQFSACFCLGEE